MCLYLHVYEQGERVKNTHQMLMLVASVGWYLEVWNLCRGKIIIIVSSHFLLCYLMVAISMC